MQTRIVQRPLFSCCRFPIPFSLAMIFPFVFVWVCILSTLLHFAAHILHIAITITTHLYCTLRHKKVVGYQTAATESIGNTMGGGTFVSVGANTSFTLSDLTVSGYNAEDGAWGEFMLQVLDNAGFVAIDEETGKKKVYCWQDNEDYENPCWTDSDGEEWDAASVSFDAGQGFWILGNGFTIQYAGQVYREDLPLNTEAIGNTALSNPFPAEITLANISVSGYNAEDGAWGECMLQILDNAGFVAIDENTGKKKTYCWQDNEDYETACWTDSDGEEWPDTITFAAGQGFWVLGAGYTIQVTNPIPRN